MTKRARMYMLVAGLRHYVTGVFLLWLPWLFHSVAFIPIFNLLPLGVWGVVMCLEGVVCTLAVTTRDADWARVGLAISVVITVTLAAGLLLGVVGAWFDWAYAVGWDNVKRVVLSPTAELPQEMLTLAAPPPSPFLPIFLAAVSAKDLIMCAQPMRSPFETLVARIREPGRRTVT